MNPLLITTKWSLKALSIKAQILVNIKTFFFVLLFLVISGCNWGDSDSNAAKSGEKMLSELTTQQLKDALMKHEIKDGAARYLTLVDQTLHLQTSSYSTTGRFYGSIKNSATCARFKDLVYKVYFYSPTKTLIEEKEVLVYKFLPPNSITDFSNDITFPADWKPNDSTYKFKYGIISAKPDSISKIGVDTSKN